mmetsp:Transcript_22028/g.70301  ORF Transcript_22028/g.70301 Transcript_22028/m.70301 type:complete len:448 (+) Transcript_22028:121-1464(+)
MRTAAAMSLGGTAAAAPPAPNSPVAKGTPGSGGTMEGCAAPPPAHAAVFSPKAVPAPVAEDEDEPASDFESHSEPQEPEEEEPASDAGGGCRSVAASASCEGADAVAEGAEAPFAEAASCEAPSGSADHARRKPPPPRPGASPRPESDEPEEPGGASSSTAGLFRPLRRLFPTTSHEASAADSAALALPSPRSCGLGGDGGGFCMGGASSSPASEAASACAPTRASSPAPPTESSRETLMPPLPPPLPSGGSAVAAVSSPSLCAVLSSEARPPLASPAGCLPFFPFFVAPFFFLGSGGTWTKEPPSCLTRCSSCSSSWAARSARSRAARSASCTSARRFSSSSLTPSRSAPGPPLPPLALREPPPPVALRVDAPPRIGLGSAAWYPCTCSAGCTTKRPLAWCGRLSASLPPAAPNESICSISASSAESRRRPARTTAKPEQSCEETA